MYVGRSSKTRGSRLPLAAKSHPTNTITGAEIATYRADHRAFGDELPNEAEDQPVLRVEHYREVEVELVGAAVRAVAFDDVDWAA